MSIKTGDRVRNTQPVIFDMFGIRSGRSGGIPVGSLATVVEAWDSWGWGPQLHVEFDDYPPEDEGERSANSWNSDRFELAE